VTANELNFKKLKVFLRFVIRTIFFCKVKMSDFYYIFLFFFFIYYFIFILFLLPLSLENLVISDEKYKNMNDLKDIYSFLLKKTHFVQNALFGTNARSA